MNTSNMGTAVITGASSGIGAVYASRLAARGYDLLLIARSRAKLEAAKEKLVRDSNVEVELLVADLTSRDDLQRVEERLRNDPKITLLVNNAGVALNASFSSSDAERLESIVQLNVIALMRVAHAALNGFLRRGRGTIVNIGSVVALAPTLLGGIYNGTKAFVLNFTQSLQNELRGTDIRVQAVLPGATSTELWELAGTPVESLPASIVMSADDMVDAALVGLDSGELVTIPSLPRVEDWERFVAARENLAPGLSRATPADRYRAGHATKS